MEMTALLSGIKRCYWHQAMLSGITEVFGWLDSNQPARARKRLSRPQSGHKWWAGVLSAVTPLVDDHRSPEASDPFGSLVSDQPDGTRRQLACPLHRWEHVPNHGDCGGADKHDEDTWEDE